MSKKKLLAITLAITLVVVLLGFALANYLSSQRVPSEGTVRTIGDIEIYWDIDLTDPVTLIDWGMLDPNETKTTTVFIYNDATIPLTLSMSVGNWSCVQAQTFLDCHWNREFYLLSARSVIDADITLEVSPDVVNLTDFTFDMLFVGQD